ncbi:MAG: multiheme c-type cytochrome [Aquificaceae bacterium]
MIALFIFIVLLSSCGDVFVEKDLLERPQAKRCSDCHSEIYREWEKSRHYLAWTSEKFKLESENYTKTKCLSCHAPHQVDPEIKPVLRVEFKEDGVSCVACHFKENTKAMHGPHKVWSPPHPSKQDINYTKPFFCAGCHQETYKEWHLTKIQKSCQDCHMQPLGEKRLVQKFPFEYFHSKKPRHDHTFPAGKAKPEDLLIELERDKGLRLKITNVGIPHNLPTADQGDPRLYIIIEASLPTGEKARLVKVLSYQAKNALVYKEPTYIELPWEEINSLTVQVQRRLSWKEERENITRVTLR